MGKPQDVNSGITHSEVIDLLEYRPDTGKFYWRAKINQVEGEAGNVEPLTGYRRIKVCGHRIMAHRLAWFYVTGTWPANRIDHKNRCRDDQRFSNLREASDGQNKANSKVRIDSVLSIKGVRLHECGGYQSRIWNGERNIHLGIFPTSEQAKEVYDKAAEAMFGEFARSS